MLKKENIYRIVCGQLQENAYLVCPEGQGGAFLVDPGDDLEALKNAVRASGRMLDGILLTHGHFDHMLAAKPLAEHFDTEVWISSGDKELLIAPEKNGYMPEVCDLVPPSAMEANTYGDTIELCGLTLRVLPTPGHTKGSVCLLEEESGIMFSGDTLFQASYGRTDLYSGDFQAMRHTLIALLQKKDDILVLPGHGAATTIGAERRRYGL